MDELKPELDDFSPRNLEDYADRLWQQRVKTERESAESDDEPESYSPPRESYFYDSYYTGEADSFRDSLDYPLKRAADEPMSPPCGSMSAVPTKRTRGRPYKEACVKITCLRPEDRLSTTLTVDFNKLQEEELGVPKSELVGGLRSSSKLPLTWTSEDLNRHILKLFPRVLNFVYMKCTQGKTLDPLPDDIKPADLRNLLGRSGLYIVPLGSLLPKGTQISDTTSTADITCTASITTTTTINSSSSNGEPSTCSVTSKQYWLPPKVTGEKVVNSASEFRISLDVSSYSPEEITLKTKNNRVVVHAKHAERPDEYGMVEQEFKRQYILPKDVDPNEVTSSLSASGILTLKAPKMDIDSGQERIIPIRFTSEDS